MSLSNNYKRKLHAFMCWKDDREYDKDAVFSDRELRDITPNDIHIPSKGVVA
jgi:hypothetical protein